MKSFCSKAFVLWISCEALGILFGSLPGLRGAPAGLSDFKEYFIHPPAIVCVARHEFANSNVVYTSISYDNGNFVTRREKHLDDLKNQNFGVSTWMAARDDGRYWQYDFNCDRELAVLDESDLNAAPGADRNYRNYLFAKNGAMNFTMAAAWEGLGTLFLGLPIWDPSSVSWSNDVLTATAPGYTKMTAQILEITNGLPWKIRVSFDRKADPDRGIGRFSPTYILEYDFGASPVSADYRFIPRAIESLDANGRCMSTIQFLKWVPSKKPLDQSTWDYREYLNASVAGVRHFTDHQDFFVGYDDRREGFRRMFGMKIPNKDFFPLWLSIMVIFTGGLFLISKAIWAKHGPKLVTEQTKEKEGEQ